MRKILLLILFMGLVCARPVLAEDLRVATLYSPPLAFEKKGEVTGFAVELVREGVRRMGGKASISLMPWKRALFMTRFGEADALFYAVRTPEREQWFHYPDESLVTEATVAIKRFGEDIPLRLDRTDYRNIRLGIGRGYYYGQKLERFLEKAHFMKVEEATTIESNFYKLLEGRIDVFLADRNLAHYFLKKNASRDMVDMVRDVEGNPVVLDSVESYLVFSRETMDKAMADRFSDVLRDMKDDGTYQRIVDSFR